MGKGKQYELDTVRDVHEGTTGSVWATRPDFSGNSKYAFADIALVWPGYDGNVAGAFYELKKRSPGNGKRASDAMCGSKEIQSGIEELHELVDMTPSWGKPYVGIKFPNRQLIIYDGDVLESTLGEAYDTTDNGPIDTIGEPKLTGGNNISVRKPNTDNWPSAQAGASDVERILDASGVPNKYWEVSE